MTGTDPTDPTGPIDPTIRQPLARPCVRVFEMVRHVDVTGFSGVGVVADGVEFPGGSVAFRWRGSYASTVLFEAGMDAVIAVHGHGGATEFRWAGIVYGQPLQPGTASPAGPAGEPERSGTAWNRHDDPHWPRRACRDEQPQP